MFKQDTDDYGLDVIIFTAPTNIKQNQGGLTRARGAQMLDLDPEIKIYPGDNHFLDGFDILREDAMYRERAHANSNNNLKCERLFLQMKHSNAKAGDVKVCCWNVLQAGDSAPAVKAVAIV